jgi:hypothetical protein
LIAWWGAGLSTLLAAVKLFELWRDRFRVDVSYNFTGNDIGNDIIIRNLSSRPMILAHWDLLYCCYGRCPKRQYESFASHKPLRGIPLSPELQRSVSEKLI